MILNGHYSENLKSKIFHLILPKLQNHTFKVILKLIKLNLQILL
jgi:hypothetical protein